MFLNLLSMNLDAIIIGIIQGIAEWLPVSSEGVIVLLENNVFHNFDNLEQLLNFALFLHLGTTCAAIVYFRKELWNIIKWILNYKNAPAQEKSLIHYLIITTAISGILGIVFLQIVENFEESLTQSSKVINILVGILLLVTAYLQFKSKNQTGEKKLPTIADAILLGLTQSFAALPGLSRSGLTVSVLLLRNFDKKEALRLSFLMSIPIVIAGNILLNLNEFNAETSMLLAFLASFVFGYLTINWLLKVAEKINFAPFLVIVGILMIIASLISV
ncbi:undecaprenyl-diphosphate phosphatase [Candidatus Dojkabacteria bacterium]|uniref:Undecaprenyl-diphosphatase n=1 Tax=Candidatus Dojkabacteria bacterium TaxID=2099670 RepID=A0A955L562_9BACT|nr:undecaprenyl-diphosphate phosphatase [Candidatus Dojkabacteria bacterium]